MSLGKMDLGRLKFRELINREGTHPTSWPEVPEGLAAKLKADEDAVAFIILDQAVRFNITAGIGNDVVD